MPLRLRLVYFAAFRLACVGLSTRIYVRVRFAACAGALSNLRDGFCAQGWIMKCPWVQILASMAFSAPVPPAIGTSFGLALETIAPPAIGASFGLALETIAPSACAGRLRTGTPLRGSLSRFAALVGPSRSRSHGRLRRPEACRHPALRRVGASSSAMPWPFGGRM
jgi:hypothetical protein